MALSPGSAQVAAAWLRLSWAGSRPALCTAACAVPPHARGTARTTAGGEGLCDIWSLPWETTALFSPVQTSLAQEHSYSVLIRVLNTLRSRLRDGAAVRQGREQLIQQSLSRPDRGVC